MKLISVDINSLQVENIQSAADALQNEGLVVYPTDTAYGLGANALSPAAVRKMYDAKGRDFSKPTHMIVQDWEMLEKLAHANKAAKKLYGAFLPGPITLILKKKPDVPDVVTANLPTVGVRIPNNPVTKMLSRLASFPYTTPSANISGGKTPYSIADVKNELDMSKIGLVVDAGKLPEVKPSTIVDLSREKIKILRHGPILQADIEGVLKITL